MKAVIYEAFGAPPQPKNVRDPTPEAHDVVVKVMAEASLSVNSPIGGNANGD